MNKTNYFFVVVIIIFMIFLAGVFIYGQRSKESLINENEVYKTENILYKTILIADKKFSEISLESQKADSYYNEASYAYENQNFKLVESNCRLARESYLLESQGYRNLKSELLSSGIIDNLIEIYIKSLDSLIEISNNMYEACEHFESAARYYDKYYNTNVAYDDRSYDMGTAEIRNMNKKIEDYDDAVEEYNQYLEDFRIELEKNIG